MKMMSKNRVFKNTALYELTRCKMEGTSISEETQSMAVEALQGQLQRWKKKPAAKKQPVREALEVMEGNLLDSFDKEVLNSVIDQSCSAVRRHYWEEEDARLAAKNPYYKTHPIDDETAYPNDLIYGFRFCLSCFAPMSGDLGSRTCMWCGQEHLMIGGPDRFEKEGGRVDAWDVSACKVYLETRTPKEAGKHFTSSTIASAMSELA